MQVPRRNPSCWKGHFCGSVAQGCVSLERSAVNREVVGSIPTRSAIFDFVFEPSSHSGRLDRFCKPAGNTHVSSNLTDGSIFAGLAQLVEQQFCKLQVVSSNLTVSSILEEYEPRNNTDTSCKWEGR
jgi:hypothetical protein